MTQSTKPLKLSLLKQFIVLLYVLFTIAIFSFFKIINTEGITVQRVQRAYNNPKDFHNSVIPDIWGWQTGCLYYISA